MEFLFRKLDDSGWSLELVDGNVCCFLSGSDFVLDGIKEVETEEKYLTTDSHLLAYKVGSNRLESKILNIKINIHIKIINLLKNLAN